jgi:hypothetical protein
VIVVSGVSGKEEECGSISASMIAGREAPPDGPSFHTAALSIKGLSKRRL